jgi:DNA-directed RNA polymerase subunit RPC12/RpoP
MTSTRTRLRKIASAGMVLKSFLTLIILIPVIIKLFFYESSSPFVIWCIQYFWQIAFSVILLSVVIDNILSRLLRCPDCNFKIANVFSDISELGSAKSKINYCAHCGKQFNESGIQNT